MPRLAFAAAALALLSTAAFAADIPSYEPPPASAPVPDAGDWGGFYVGVHGGYGWGDADVDGLGSFDDLDGFVVGGQAGMNWQWNSFVYGIEGDGSYSDISGSEDGLDVDVDWLASIRGRVGVGFDRFLVYGTGGAAFAGAEASVGVDDDDNTHFGWVAGGGAEVMLTPNITVGAEYLHYDLSEEEYDIGGGFEADGDVDVVRGRVNVKFGSLFGG